MHICLCGFVRIFTVFYGLQHIAFARLKAYIVCVDAAHIALAGQTAQTSQWQP